MVTRVQTSSVVFLSATTSAPVTLAGVSAGNLLVVDVLQTFGGNPTRAISSVNDAADSAALALVRHTEDGGAAMFIDTYQRVATNSGSHTVTVTLAGTGDAIIVMTEYASVGALNGTPGGNTGTSATATPGAVTPSGVNLYHGVALFNSSGSGVTGPSGWGVAATQDSGTGSRAFHVHWLSGSGTQNPATGYGASATWVAHIATFADASGPAITTQPTSVRTSAGSTASFSAAATGAASQRWQSNASGSWADISGETGTTHTTPPLAAGTAYAVRIIFSDGTIESTSDPADVWTPAAATQPARVALRGFALLRSRLLVGASDAALAIGETTALGEAPASGDISGTSALTLGAISSTAAGTVAVAGASSLALGAVTQAAAGAVAVVGASAVTLGALSQTAAGTVGSSPITGTSALTLGSITGTAAGAVVVAGASAQTVGAVASAAAGSVLVAGVQASALGTVTTAGAGAVRVAGAGAATLAAITQSATGVAGMAPVVGQGAATLGAILGAGAGLVVTPEAIEWRYDVPGLGWAYAVPAAAGAWRFDHAGASPRYDIPADGLHLDVPASSLRVDIPSIGAA